MATFNERYEELFGPLDDGEAPEIRELAKGGQDRAINLQDEYGDMSSPNRMRAIPDLPAAPTGTQGTFGGLMKAGTATLGEALVGIPEYIARKNEFGQGLAENLSGVRDVLSEYRQGIYDSMDQSVIDMKGREFTTLDPDKTIWQGSPLEVGEALMYKFVEQIPMTLATLVPGGIMARAGASAKAITYLGASEAGISVGFIANDIADGIKGMSDDELAAESPRYSELAQQHGSQRAREIFTEEAQGMAPIIGGLMVGAISATAGRFLTPVFEPGAGATLARRVTTGALSEGFVQEGPQETVEQVATNIAQMAYDGDIRAMDGALEAYAQGTAVGGPMGGIFAGLAGRGPTSDDGSTPVDRDVPDPPDNQAIDLEAPWDLTPREKDMFGEDAIPLDNRDPMAEPVPGALNLTGELLASGVDRDPAVAAARETSNRLLGAMMPDAERPGSARPEGEADGFASHGVHDQVDPLIAAAVTANLRTDNKMDEIPQVRPGATRDELNQEQAQGEQNQKFGDAMSGLMGALDATGQPFQPAAGPPGTDVATVSPQDPAARYSREELFPPPGDDGSNIPGQTTAYTQGDMPDALDMPSAEPLRDLKAQLKALDDGERSGVYLSAANLEGLNIDLGDRIVVEDFDGKGGAMVFADQDTADSAQIWLEEGANMQQVLGFLTGAGDGKSMSPDAVVVQQLDDTGSVKRESQVTDREEAEQVAAEWGGNTQVLSQEEALARREEEIHRESQPDLFDTQPEMGTEERTVTEPRAKTGEFRVRFRDDAGETIEDRSFGSKEKAITFANKLVDEYDLVDSDIDYLTGPVRPGEARAALEKADARITVSPIRKIAKTRTETVAVEKAKEGRKTPAKTAGEKAADKIRKSQSFDERGESVQAVADATSEQDAAEKLEAAAVKRLRAERKGTEGNFPRKGAISGMFHPDAYRWNDPAHKAEYAAWFDELSAIEDEVEAATAQKGKAQKDAEGKVVLKPIPRVIDNPKRLKELRSRKTDILKSMRQLRQVAKPTRVALSFVKAAKTVARDRTTGAAKSTDKFDQLEGVMGENEGEAITSQYTPSAEDQVADAEQTKPSALKKEAAKTVAAIDTADTIGDLDPNLTREDIDATEGHELDILFEQALNYYRGRGKGDKIIDLMRYEAKGKSGTITYIADFTTPGKPRLLQGDFAKFEKDLERIDKLKADGKYVIQQGAAMPDYTAPVTDGQKKKLVRRVLAAQANQSEGDTRSEGGRLVTKSVQSGAMSSGETRSTQALTSRQIKADESVEDKLKRENKAKKLRKKLEQAVREAAERLRVLQEQKAWRYGDGEMNPDGMDLLMARRALEAQLQIAQSVLQGWRSDKNMLDFAESIIALLNKKRTITVDGKSKQVPVGPADLRGWYLTQLKEVPNTEAGSQRETSILRVVAWNRKLLENLRRLSKLERLNKNTVYRSAVAPVLRKLTLSVDAGFSQPTDSTNPTGIPQRVLDKYAELRAEGRSHEGAVDNMADIGKLMPHLTPRDFKGLYDQLLIEWRRPSPYAVGYEGKAGPTPTAIQPDYKPTQSEMEGLAWAMEQWRTSTTQSDMWMEDFYTPVKKMLVGWGFEFDSVGRLIVETQHGKPIFSKLGGTAQEFQENRLEQEAESGVALAEFKSQTLADRDTVEDQQLDANDHVKAAGIFARFRKVVDHGRVTKDAMIDAEFKMLEALDKAGFIVNQGSFSATIRVAGHPDITYRKTAYDLRDSRINKKQAHDRMSAIRKSYGTAKAKYAVRAASTAGDITAEENPDIEHGFFIKAVDLPKNSPSMRKAANLIGDLLINNNEVTATQVLRVLATELDPNSIYGIAANKLLYAADFEGVAVKWGDTKKLKELGVFNTGDNTVRINKDKLQANRDSGEQYTEERAVHVVLHEILHSATHNALRTNRALKHSMIAMQTLMQKLYPDSTTYGLKRGLPIDEFVTEMFVNQELQDLAKRTPVGQMADMNLTFMGKVRNMWQHFKMTVLEGLGIEITEDSTVFDVVFALEDQLFENAGVWNRDVNKDFNFGGGVIGDLGKQTIAKIGLTNQLESSFRKVQTKLGQGMMSLQVTSMKQLRSRYNRYFPDGSLRRYIDKFFERNARNAELMEVVEGLSKEWTKLHTANQAGSLELSRLGTESSLYRVNPTQSLTHESNKHITSSSMKTKHAELAARYQALDGDTKKMWDSLQTYYKEALTRETHQMLLNALRAVTTMENTVFDAKYSMDNIGKFNTKEAITEEFAEFLPEKRPDIIATIQRLASVPEMEQGVYFPLMRFGEYAVYSKRTVDEKTFTTNKDASDYYAKQQAKDPTLKVGKFLEDGRWRVKTEEVEFVTAEEPGKIDQERERLIEKYGREAVGDVTKKFQTHADIAIEGASGLEGLIKALGDNGAAIAAVKNLYLRGLADTSFRKREMTRKSVKGVDYDLQHRSFATYSKQSAYYTAQLEYGYQLAEALRDMTEFATNRHQSDYTGVEGKKTTLELDNVVKSIIERDKMSADPYMVGNFTRKALGFTQFMMLTSASYHMINSSQPWMVTLPTMAGRHGWGASFSAMKHAQSLIGNSILKGIGKSGAGVKLLWDKNAGEEAFGVFHQLSASLMANETLTAEQKSDYMAMLTDLRRRHTLEVSPLTELREVASGIDNSKSAKMLDASRVMAHMVEVNNRVLTAIAAYDLQLAKGLGEGLSTADAKAAAVEYASDMVSDTQFDYSSANKPPAFQKYPILFQFMQWSQHIYALLATNLVAAHRQGWLTSKNEARKTLFGVLGTHAAVGGILGVALQPIKMAIGMVALGLSDEDDPITLNTAMSGRWFDRWVTAGLADAFGTEVSQIMSKGLPMAFGTDLSTRMSIGTLYFVDLRTDNAQSIGGSILASFGGASVNQGLSMLTSLGKIADGDWQRGVEGLMPKVGKDLLKAGRLMQEGLVNNAGDTVLDTSDIGYWQIALQTLGFTPEAQSNFYSGNAAMMDVQRFVRERRSQLLKEFRTAEGSDRHRVRKEIREFNRRYRLSKIDSDGLYSTVRSKREREAQYRRTGTNIDPSKYRQYEEYGEPYK